MSKKIVSKLQDNKKLCLINDSLEDLIFSSCCIKNMLQPTHHADGSKNMKNHSSEMKEAIINCLKAKTWKLICLKASGINMRDERLMFYKSNNCSLQWTRSNATADQSDLKWRYGQPWWSPTPGVDDIIFWQE